MVQSKEYDNRSEINQNTTKYLMERLVLIVSSKCLFEIQQTNFDRQIEKVQKLESDLKEKTNQGKYIEIKKDLENLEKICIESIDGIYEKYSMIYFESDNGSSINSFTVNHDLKSVVVNTILKQNNISSFHYYQYSLKGTEETPSPTENKNNLKGHSSKDTFHISSVKLPGHTRMKAISIETHTYNLADLRRAHNDFMSSVNVLKIIDLLANTLHNRRSAKDNYVCESTLIWPAGDPRLMPVVRILKQSIESSDCLERLQSFLLGFNVLGNTWPEEAVVRPGTLATAGFTYEGIGTEVICRSCGLVSNTEDWEKDNDSYAMFVHQQSCSPCSFLERYSNAIYNNNVSSERHDNDLRVSQLYFVSYIPENVDVKLMFVNSVVKDEIFMIETWKQELTTMLREKCKIVPSALVNIHLIHAYCGRNLPIVNIVRMECVYQK